MELPGKVIHLDDATHALLKEHCELANIQMIDFVRTVIKREIHNSRLAPVPPRPQTSIPATSEEAIAEIVSRPPFWASKPKEPHEVDNQ